MGLDQRENETSGSGDHGELTSWWPRFCGYFRSQVQVTRAVIAFGVALLLSATSCEQAPTQRATERDPQHDPVRQHGNARSPKRRVTRLPASASKHYVFPVQPPTAASYSQGHHDYPASDIFAPEGTAFVAVTSGTISEVSRTDKWKPDVDDPATRGGLFVSLVGADGVRYYGSHLASVANGIRSSVSVTAGQVLGTVGSSGNARGIAPHLHFGISNPTEPGDWEVRRGELDPFPYLEAWRRGKSLSPRPALQALGSDSA